MSLSIKALNEKLNATEQVKHQIFNRTVMLKSSLITLLSFVSLTINFNLGIVFILPLLALVLKVDRKWGLILSGLISAMVLLIDIKGGLSTILVVLLLLTFVNDKQLLHSRFTLFLISGISYGINVFLEVTIFNPFAVAFIALYIYLFHLVYNRALEIRMYNHIEDRHLFTEEIVAVLAVAVNVLLGLFMLEFSAINIGFILTLVVIMTLGVISSPIYIIGFSLVMYLVLLYTNLLFDGVQIIPFVGLISGLLPKRSVNIKTFIYYLLAPALFVLGIVQGDMLFVLINLAIGIKIFYFAGDYLLKNESLLTHQPNENNLMNLYLDNFKEDISKRLLNFGEIFETFAYKSTESNSELQKIDDSINEIFEKHCKGCLKKELCLNQNYIKTYNYFSQILKQGNHILDESKRRFIDLFNAYCLNAYDVINTGIYLNEEYMLNNAKTESLIYQSQLQGLSRIIQNYALELNSNYSNQNEKILYFKEGLNKLGMNISFLKINNVSQYNINVELGITSKHPFEKHFIKDLFEEIFNEPIDLIEMKSRIDHKKFNIISKKEFEIEFGTSYIGKDGKRICGDNFIKCENNKGNTVVALCDGMGSGYSAHVESKTTLELLNKMLETGADDEMTVSVINTLVSLKEYKERFSTLDYLVINRSNKSVDFYKIGSAPSFIIRGNKVIRIDNDNLPIGFTDTIDKVTVELEMDDIIVVVSDGVVDRLNNLNKFESILTKLARNTPVQMAHDIIQIVIKENGGKILDDMTAIVLKVEKRYYEEEVA